jgi:two-component system heavy metal sensor histidine kinase CusS
LSEDRVESRAAPARSWSLASRLTLWYAASTFTLIATATGLLYWVLVRNVNREEDQFLVDSIQIMRELLRDRPNDFVSLRQEVEWEGAARQYTRMFMRVVDQQGAVIMETPGTRELIETWPSASVPADVVPGLAADATCRARACRVLAAWAYVGPNRDRQYLIQEAVDRTAEQELLVNYRRRLWAVLGIAFLAAGVMGHSIARHGMRPLRSITATAGRIRSSNLHERIDSGGLPSELAILSNTFNSMLAHIEDAFARLSSLSADLAHELRTPVNNLRGELEVALGRSRSAADYEATLASALEECVHLSHMIDSLMFLARADLPHAQIHRTRVDVGEELAAVAEFHEPAATEAGLRLQVLGAATVSLAADLDRALFQRAIGNLVTNAIAYTTRGGTVQLRASQSGRDLRVEVIDTGVGIAPEHLARVSDRFYRVDRSRSSASGGLGLGLAIVKSIAQFHGGRVQINSQPGRGTIVTLVLPDSVVQDSIAGPSPAFTRAV